MGWFIFEDEDEHEDEHEDESVPGPNAFGRTKGGFP